MIIDLHTHTKPLSDDSHLEPAELIHRAKQAGIDAICFTEHDWFWDRDALAKLRQEHNFLILPGVEINTDDGHFLVFGIEKYSFGIWHVENLKRIVDEAGGAMILVHPFRRHFHDEDDLQVAVEQCCQKPFFKFVDIIETFNGRASEKENQFSRELCHRLNLKSVGGSDAHSTSEMPSYATFFERNISNLEELIIELKAGRFRAVDLRQSAASL